MTEVVVLPDLETLAAEALVRLERAVEATEGVFSLVLAGGSTPDPVHRALAARPDWPWWRTVIAFGDERCVPPDRAESNYRAAREALLDHVSPLAVLRVPAEAPSVERAADLYAARLAELPGAGADVVCLGMGDDGHTASLFPGTDPTEDRDVIAVPEPAPGKHRRVTVTEAFLDRAALVLVLVSGAGKAARLAEVLAGGDLPLARVLSRRGDLPTVVLADEAAASALEKRT
jgi:6-phosphogluconolactonase